MYSISDFKNIIDAAETLALLVEEHLMNNPDTLTKLTIAVSEFRMAQIQADENLKQVLEDMADQDNTLQDTESFDTLRLTNKYKPNLQ